MRKIILILSVLTLLLVACGEPWTASAEPETLDWFIDRSALPSNWNMNEPIFKAITDATGIQCTFNIPAEDPDTKLNLLMVSGQMPDLVTIYNRDLIAEMIAENMVWDLEELFNTYLPDALMLKEFPNDLKTALIARDTGWYAYPCYAATDEAYEFYGSPTEEIAQYYENAKYDNTFGIYFYKEYVDQLGIDVEAIHTEADLMDVLAKINEAGLTNATGASVYTLMTDGQYTVDYALNTILANTFGAMQISDDGQYQSIYYSDEYRDALAFLNHCGQLGYITETQLIMDEPSVISICNSGRSACWIGGLTTLKSDVDIEDKWVSAGSIVSNAGATPVMGYSNTIHTGWLSTFATTSSAKPEACARFIDYMASREGMLVHMYGIEGVDYVWDEEGCLHRTEVGAAKVEDGVSGMFGFFAFHNSAFTRSVDWIDTSKTSPSLIYGNSENVEIYDSSVFDLPSGYVATGSDEAFIKTEVDNYVKPAIAELILASNDEDFATQYDAFIARLDALGLRTYDAYVNEQVQKNCEEKGVELKPIN